MTAATPPSDRILVRGLRLWAHVGVLEQERLLGQWFELDLSLGFDLAAAGASDQLEQLCRGFLTNAFATKHAAFPMKLCLQRT